MLSHAFLLSKGTLRSVHLEREFRWNTAITGSLAAQDPGQIKTSHGRTSLGTTLEVEEDPAFGRRPGPTGGERGIAMATLVEQPLDRPCFSTVKAGPDGAMVATARTVTIAVQQDVLVLDG